MNLFLVVVIGAVMGALGAVGIFFEPKEPYKFEILGAGTLKGILVSLLTALSLGANSRWWQGAGYGAFYGLAFGLVIFLAKGGFKSKDAPYVVASSVVVGLITGILIVVFTFPKT